eukprot:Anaeramoba_ignava/a350487_55.p1 GENE.a350487_55~~a350487_55.p1  ORF type:complete len:432 (+),score=120.14 a350487_55:133-1428(+)
MSYIQRISRRKGNYKKKIDFSESRTKRLQMSIQISKDKREQQLMKKRFFHSRKDESSDSDDIDDQEFIDQHLQLLPQYAQAINGNNENDLKLALVKVRKLISVENQPPIKQIVDIGITPRLVQLLKHSEDPKILFEAAWILTNIASGTKEQTKTVVKEGAIPIFVNLLSSSDEDVQEQSIWAIGNIAGDQIKYRDELLNLGTMEKILTILRVTTNEGIIQNSAWAISNLSRGKPKPDFKSVSIALPFLERLINSSNIDTVIDSCWALSYLTNGNDDEIEECVNSGIVPTLISLLRSDNLKLLTPVLRAIGNIVTGTDNQTELVLNYKPLENLCTFLDNPRKAIRKEICWILSNITAGIETQIQQVLDVPNLMEKVINILKNDDLEVKKEAAWTVSNAITGAKSQQIRFVFFSFSNLKMILILILFQVIMLI